MNEERKHQEPIYWACDEPEEYTHDDRDEAIGEYLDDLLCDLTSQGDDWPETIKVEGAVPMTLGERDPDPNRVLEFVLEDLDEGYGGGDHPDTAPTDVMKAAAMAFCSVIRRVYQPYQCEVIVTEEVNVRDGVEAHRPDWRAPAAGGKAVS